MPKKYLKNSLGFLVLLFINFFINELYSQVNYDLSWILGGDYRNANSNLIKIKFNLDTIESVQTIQSQTSIRADIGLICNDIGEPKVIATNCSVLNSQFDTIENSLLLNNRLLNYCETGGGWPFDQSCIVLPYNDDKEKFIILYTNTQTISREQDSLKWPFYGKLFELQVDFSNNVNGLLNDVWKEASTDTVSVSFITACKKNNNQDWWVIVPLDGRPCYNIYSYTIDGLKLHQTNCLGDIAFNDEDFYGQASFSPNKKYFARFNIINGLHFFNFDPDEGILKDIKINHPQVPNGNYSSGLCFSPNSKYLYLFCDKVVYQYEITKINDQYKPLLIDTLITSPGKEGMANFNHGLLAPDGRIYIAGDGFSSKYLHVINNPNCLGKLCDLIQQAIQLPTTIAWGIPNFPHFRDYSNHNDCKITNTKSIENDLEIQSTFNKNRLLYQFNSNTGNKIIIFNINGKTILSSQFENSSGYIDLDYFASGMYLIKLMNEKNQKIQKFIKEF